VFGTHQKTAVKAFRYPDQYHRELKVYERLFKLDVWSVSGFAVPHLDARDDHLLIIEMTIVNPPYVVDFTASYVDVPPPFSRLEMRSAENHQRKAFGPKWPAVKKLLLAFHYLGINLVDIHPGNIAFGPDPQEPS
jgi:hypothetical protein